MPDHSQNLSLDPIRSEDGIHPEPKIRIKNHQKPTPKLSTERGTFVIQLGARTRTINLGNI